MTLSEILIAAGVTPDDLHPDCKFIAQDWDGLTEEFLCKPLPFIGNNDWWAVDSRIKNSANFGEIELASDLETPLSREQFTADYAAHQAAKQ